MSKRVKKWTPGPWAGKEIKLCDQDLVGVFVALLSTGHKGRYEEGVANLRLFRSAPDLVEALEDMLADYRDACEEWDAENQEQGLEIIEKAEAALSLVYGETQ